MTDYLFVYTTTANETEAATIAKAAVEAKLAACANILPKMSSVYRWKGKIQIDDEVVLIFKTNKENFGSLENLIKERHSYECPCVIGLPIDFGHEPYLDWIKASLD